MKIIILSQLPCLLYFVHFNNIFFYLCGIYGIIEIIYTEQKNSYIVSRTCYIILLYIICF
jgi:hypothetical protein